MLLPRLPLLLLPLFRRDSLDNTALHYATQRWPEEAVTALLELGANIGIKNYLREIPISRIRPQTMEDFLDSHCLRTEGDVMHQVRQRMVLASVTGVPGAGVQCPVQLLLPCS